jgi:glycine dehydrogenase subunit 1
MHASEMAVERQLTRWRARTWSPATCPSSSAAAPTSTTFPASVDHLIQRGEFLTSYTPYQPEIAQGTLQVLFEFQTQVARLLRLRGRQRLDVRRLDRLLGSDRMARRITGGRRRSLVGPAPALCQVAKTMARSPATTLETALPELSAETDAERLIARSTARPARRRPISRHPRPDHRPDADRRGGACRRARC